MYFPISIQKEIKLQYNIHCFSIVIPACTLSPTCSSDIVTDFPFSRDTVDIEGKHLSLVSCGKNFKYISCLSWCYCGIVH